MSCVNTNTSLIIYEEIFFLYAHHPSELSTERHPTPEEDKWNPTKPAIPFPSYSCHSLMASRPISCPAISFAVGVDQVHPKQNGFAFAIAPPGFYGILIQLLSTRNQHPRPPHTIIHTDTNYQQKHRPRHSKPSSPIQSQPACHTCRTPNKAESKSKLSTHHYSPMLAHSHKLTPTGSPATFKASQPHVPNPIQNPSTSKASIAASASKVRRI